MIVVLKFDDAKMSGNVAQKWTTRRQKRTRLGGDKRHGKSIHHAGFTVVRVR
jgi:hypothetical protein